MTLTFVGAVHSYKTNRFCYMLHCGQYDQYSIKYVKNVDLTLTLLRSLRDPTAMPWCSWRAGARRGVAVGSLKERCRVSVGSQKLLPHSHIVASCRKVVAG